MGYYKKALFRFRHIRGVVILLLLGGVLTGCGDSTYEIYEREYDKYTVNQFLEKNPNYQIRIDNNKNKKKFSKTELGLLSSSYNNYVMTLTLLDSSGGNKEYKELGSARMYYFDSYYFLVDTRIVVKFTKNKHEPLYFYVLNLKKNLPAAAPQVSGDTVTYLVLTINQFLKKYPNYRVLIDHEPFDDYLSDYDKQVIYNNSTVRPIVVGLLTRDDPNQVKDYVQLDGYDIRYEIGNTGILVKCVKNANEPFYFYVPKNHSETSKEDRTIQ